MRTIVTAAAAALFLSVATSAGFAASTTGNASVTIIRPISVVKNKDLLFGTIIAPSSGSANVSISTAGARNTNGLGTAGGAFGNADFTVSGEGGQSVTVSVSPSVTLTNGTASLVVTTAATDTGTQVLSGSIGSAGTLDVAVGGTITISNTTVSGTYAGTLTVTANYN